eukprot:gene28144-31245_t
MGAAMPKGTGGLYANGQRDCLVGGALQRTFDEHSDMEGRDVPMGSHVDRGQQGSVIGSVETLLTKSANVDSQYTEDKGGRDSGSCLADTMTQMTLVRCQLLNIPYPAPLSG